MIKLEIDNMEVEIYHDTIENISYSYVIIKITKRSGEVFNISMDSGNFKVLVDFLNSFSKNKITNN